MRQGDTAVNLRACLRHETAGNPLEVLAVPAKASAVGQTKGLVMTHFDSYSSAGERTIPRPRPATTARAAAKTRLASAADVVG